MTKNKPAARTSAFYWREQPSQIDWSSDRSHAAKKRATSVVQRRRDSGEKGINALKGSVR